MTAPKPLPPDVLAKVRRTLDAEARRLLAERLEGKANSKAEVRS
jgi:hypothetical protein